MTAVMRIKAAILFASVLAGSLLAVAGEKGLTVSGVRYFSYPGFTRIVLELESATPYVLTKSGDGRTLTFSAYGVPLAGVPAQLPIIQDSVVKEIEARQEGERKTIAIVLAAGAGEFKDFVLRGPDRIVIDIQRGSAAPPAPVEGTLPVIVLDPGHGGAQNGIVAGREVEKVVCLEIAQAVRAALRRSPLKMKVLLSRETDEQHSFDVRAAGANAAEASLFMSFHLGLEPAPHVFILDPDEGQAPTAVAGPDDFLGFDAVNEQQQRLWGTQQAKHASESGRLGRLIIRSLTGRESGEPEQAPLALLRNIDAPAVLVETGAGQDIGRIAEQVAQGIEQYVREKR